VYVCLGSVGKYLAVYSATPAAKLAVSYVFQCIAGLGQVVINTCPTVVANLWFAENERVKANMVGTIAGAVGNPNDVVLTSLSSK
jgi:hypothetical protein